MEFTTFISKLNIIIYNISFTQGHKVLDSLRNLITK